MASQTPFILADNVYDRINLYPQAALASTAVVPGREAQYVADYRRERTYLQFATAVAGHAVDVNLGAGNTRAVDTIWLDRGHNLWGQGLTLRGSPDAFASNPVNLALGAIPALGTVGGDPTVGWCVTEEGAIYRIIALTTAQQYWRLITTSVPAAAVIMPGVIVGQRLQMLNYSSVLDEDEGERDERQENSLIKGYYGRERVYTARKLRVQLATIGITEYDTIIRTMRRVLFERDQPFFGVMNYGTKPERGWLYQYQGGNFSAPAERIYRRHSFVAQELGPLIR